MKIYFTLGIFVFLSVQILCGQSNISARKLSNIADSLYRVKNYDKASNYYIQALHIAEFKIHKINLAYNAACCLALQSKTDSAYLLLNTALAFGKMDKNILLNDSDLTSLQNDEKWKTIISKLDNKTQPNTNPKKAKFVTDDIQKFWKAYDLYLLDSSNAYSIFKSNYFDTASEGMNDYMGLKVGSIQQFVNHIK